VAAEVTRLKLKSQSLLTSAAINIKMNIAIANRQRTKKINTRILKQVVAELFTELEITEAELGIHLVGAKEMARVNRQFLQHEGSTDVITFDHAEPGRAGSPLPDARQQKSGGAHGVTRPTIHGELFLCVDEAISQARQFGTNWQSEVVRYVVHGVLHLLGYDDLKPALRREMKRVENQLVRGLAKRFTLAQLSRPAKIGA
jgi:probable rRNA maturation factor